jgi:hypothetical protein
MSKAGLHNKPAGCGAAKAYVSGPGSEEEEVAVQVSHPYRTAGQIIVLIAECQNDYKCGTGRDIEGSRCDVL